MILAEIPYLRIHPDILQIPGGPTIRWYGVSYVVAFVLAWIVLRGLAKRKRWPVEPERVMDVLFWGIVGVFAGARLGWVLFYGIPGGSVTTFWDVFTVWEGGMSFHGGLLGVAVAYWIFSAVTGKPRGELFDGLTLATPLGIVCVRLGNYINAELFGERWDGPWAMRFPRYGASEFGTPAAWVKAYEANPDAPNLYTAPRHPSQLYEALFEGLLMYLVLRWLMLRRGVGGGRISAAFLLGYGIVRLLIEQVRVPDVEFGRQSILGLVALTRGQQLSLIMIGAGVVTYVMCVRKARRQRTAGS